MKPLLLSCVAAFILAGCGGGSSDGVASRPRTALFGDLSLPPDAAIDAEVVHRPWGFEQAGLLTFSSRASIEEIQRHFDETLPAQGWRFGDRLGEKEEPYWPEWENTGHFRRLKGKELLTVRLWEPEEPSPRPGVWIVRDGEDEPEAPAVTSPLTVHVWIWTKRPDREMADEAARALAHRTSDAPYQYVWAGGLSRKDPETAARIAGRLGDASPDDYAYTLLAAQALEKLGEARLQECIARYRRALELLRHTGEVDEQKRIREQLEKLEPPAR